MPKIILEFDAIAERDDAIHAQYGGDYASAIDSFKSNLTRKYKHVSLSDEQHKILDDVWDIIGNNFDGVVGL